MRTGYYLRYEENGEWNVAVVESDKARKALVEDFERRGVSFDDHGEVEIPEYDGKMVTQR